MSKQSRYEITKTGSNKHCPFFVAQTLQWFEDDPDQNYEVLLNTECIESDCAMWRGPSTNKCGLIWNGDRV